MTNEIEAKPRQFTAEEVRALTKIDRWRLRECSMCGTGLHYLISPDRTEVAFDGSCWCVSYVEPPRISSWDAIARTVNMQSAKVQDEMLAQLAGERP